MAERNVTIRQYTFGPDESLYKRLCENSYSYINYETYLVFQVSVYIYIKQW